MSLKEPTPELRAFGAEVARFREQAGITRTELAKRATVTRSYVGQVETGITRCRNDFAVRLDKALDAGTVLSDAWNDLLRGTGYPKFFTDFTKAEASAVLVRSYQVFVVHGLLQTEEYARVLMVSESSVAGRMKRQSILTRDEPVIVCVVLNESVLYSDVGGQAVMHEQLEHLIAVSKLPNVTLQIALTGYYRGVHGAFSIATQKDGSDVAYLTHLTGGNTTSEPGDIVHAEKAFVVLQAHALSPDASRDLIRKVADERWTT